MNNLLNANYQKIFPENLKKYKNLRTLAIEFEKTFKREVISEISKLAIFKNLNIQSDEILSELAWQYVINNWQESLDRNVKIALIKNAYWAHATKGTKAAIVENLKKLKYPITVNEWYEYEGNPFTFKVVANHLNSDPEWIDRLVEIIDKYKNCRSILESVDLDYERNTAKYKIGNFKVIEFNREYIGMHYDQERKINIKLGCYRTIEMEVERKCMKD